MGNPQNFKIIFSKVGKGDLPKANTAHFLVSVERYILERQEKRRDETKVHIQQGVIAQREKSKKT